MPANSKRRRTLVPKPVVSEGSGSRVGSHRLRLLRLRRRRRRGSLLARKGLATDYLRLRALPFSPEVLAFVASHDRVYVIDQNRDGQMYDASRARGRRNDAPKLRSIRHYDGFPLDAETVIEGIEAGEKH